MHKNDTITLIKLLNKELSIPVYQRPYEWNRTNVFVLLNDINRNYNNDEEINLGTIIVCKNKEETFDIVDGQQRLITLSLLLKILNENIKINLLDKQMLCVNKTEKLIRNNYKTIKEYIAWLGKNDNLDNFYNYLIHKVNFYLLEAKSINEAFQLFDGRNSKYKNLTPVDLLKAYHLGALPRNYPLKNLLTTWDKNIKEEFKIDNSCNKIEYLYNNILFNVYNWSLNRDIKKFTKNDIYLYKGYINKNENNYSYIKYYKTNDKNIYQMNKPFEAGEDFFNFTNYYIEMLDNLINYYSLKNRLEIDENDKRYDLNLRFINYLYYGALLMFNDKFGNNNKNNQFIEDFIYKYSIIHRIKNKSVSLQTLNHYVLSTKYNFFYECNNALTVEELLKLEPEGNVNAPTRSEKLGEMREDLWKKLK